LQDDPEYDFGLGKDDKYIDSVPVDITLALLQRGQERYNIFCAPCHSKVGDGKGVLVTKGYVPPPTFHAERLRDIPDGYIYDVIMNGVRNMPSYKYQIPVNDRWAITAYVRALQLNQNATLDDVPKEMRDQLK
jgi:mono/diheme cytochrome c family protein